MRVSVPSQVQVRSVPPPMNHPAVGTHLDLDLLRVFGVASETVRAGRSRGQTHCSGGSSRNFSRTGRWE